ncbi:MAG: hypothetical protein P8Y70_00990 [Candidatus Lokiarchaeota archaeon]
MVTLLIGSERNIQFFDVLSKTNVSNSYSSIVNPLRYFVEPIAGLSYILGMDFDWIIPFIIIYIVLRFLYLFLKRRNAISAPFRISFLNPLQNLITFTFTVLMVMLIIVGVIILIGYIFFGFFIINLNFMRIIQVGTKFSFLFIIVKFLITFSKKIENRLNLTNLKSPPLKFSLKNNLKLKLIKSIRKEAFYFVGFLVLFLELNIILISIPLPVHRINTSLNEDEFLIDFHGHTIYSDGWLTPEQRVLWYMEHGINIAAFSDHDNLNGAHIANQFVQRFKLDFKVITAVEYTDHQNDIHLNYYGIDELVVPLESKTQNGPIAMNVSDMIKYIKGKGGFVIVNHYNENLNDNGDIGSPYSLEDLMKWGVDGFEILNAGTYQGDILREFCLNNSLICLGGSDIHTNEELHTFVRLKLKNPMNKTVENIFQTLHNNTHQVIQIYLYPKLFTLPDNNFLGFTLFEKSLNYFFHIGKLKIISWIIWSTSIYVIISTVIIKKKRDIHNE